MGVRAEIESNIISNWTDMDVARWVINKLPLLEHAFTHSPCPVYTIDLNKGLLETSDEDEVAIYKPKQKFVMSGGFEGTEGHLKVVEEMYETRALTAKPENLVVLILEPDSYIVKQKHREPLVNLEQRIGLWSTSGLVEAVLVLPDRPDNVSPYDFYDKQIHNLISPASWCVNVENPHYFEILNRGQEQQAYDLVRMFVHHIEVHTSFLDSTRTLKKETVKDNLRQYLLDLLSEDRHLARKPLSVDEEVHLYMERIAKGL